MNSSLAITTGSADGVGSTVTAAAVARARLSVPITVYAAVPKPRGPLPPRVEWRHVRATAHRSAALGALIEACEGIRAGRHFALVTGPVRKSDFAGYAPKTHVRGETAWGHTEILADYFEADVCMMFINRQYRVGLVTQHVPLARASGMLTPELIVAKGELFGRFLRGRRTADRTPVRMGVAGVNPHAGVDFGDDTVEKKIIRPAMDQLRALGFEAEGPVPPDSAFYQYDQQGWDGLISMYHDHALTFLKTAYFEQTVNVTLGLPFVRTSVDHGPATDIRADQARWANMLAAIEWAVMLSQER